jgi:hypothetical protein
VACPLCLPRRPQRLPGSGAAAGRRAKARCEAPLRPEGRPPILACPPGTARCGGERGRWRRRTGAGSWLSPLPGSYSRIGTAGRLFAGRCPTLTARVGSLKTFTGIIPAAACVPVHRQLARAGAAAPAPGRVVRWSSPPTRSRPARGRPPLRRPRAACRGRSSSCTWRADAAAPSMTGPASPAAGRPAGA